MSKSFPFFPQEDNLLGKILADIASEKGERDIFIQAIYSHLGEGKEFVFTPKVSKQTVMNLVPPQIRILIQNKNQDKLNSQFLTLIRGNPARSESPQLDIAMELLEWILMGFDENQIQIGLLNVLTNGKYLIDQDTLQTLKNRYNDLLSEDENGNRKREDSDH